MKMVIDTKESLEMALRLAGVQGEWINPDQYGFSRDYRIKVGEQEIIIEWYPNFSTVKIGNLYFWADSINPDSGYPYRGEWIAFGFRGHEFIHLKVKEEIE